MPSEEEMREWRKNLQKNNKVDLIVIHCASFIIVELISHGMYKSDLLTDYLEAIRQTVKFKK